MENGRGKWTTRSTFILAAIGSAVGLGNAWRFPGLAAKHGGGAFILVYLLAMIIIGIPLLMMEISIGRKLKQGAPGAMRGINKKLEPIGWAATTNAFIISVYYAVVFAWVIMMAIFSFKFIGFTGSATASEQAGGLWAELIKVNEGYDTVSGAVLLCLMIAWGFIYACIRNGADSVSKVVKYTVFLPVVCLVIMAIKGFTMQGAGEGLVKLFIPDWSAFGDATLWIDAFGQVFYSLSIMMAIMFAYGSFLKEESNIATDCMIIAFSDFIISILSSIVLFTTMYGAVKIEPSLLQHTLEDGTLAYYSSAAELMASKGSVSTAFIMYPTAMVNLTDSGVFNSIFAFVFYFCLCTLAIDSAFSIVEGVSTAISDKFRIDKKKTTIGACVIAGLLSVWFTTGKGLQWLDIVDNWCNSYNLIIVGILEAIAVGWCFKTSKVLDEINKNTKRLKMAKWWFIGSIKFIAPAILLAFLVWNVVNLFMNGGIYGASDGYSLASNVIGGWLMTAIVFASGFIVKLIVKILKKKKGFLEPEVAWADDKPEETKKP